MRCLHNGTFEIRLVISEEHARYIEDRGYELGETPDGYANALLNMALLTELDDMEQRVDAALSVGPQHLHPDNDGREITSNADLLASISSFKNIPPCDDDLPF